jgi:hypothetical protein
VAGLPALGFAAIVAAVGPLVYLISRAVTLTGRKAA